MTTTPIDPMDPDISCSVLTTDSLDVRMLVIPR